ncbi:hypothetical protein EJP81_24870 (plasmid) [Rahnella aquatilis]|nr:hypothetical protein D3Z09_23905 [Rahnella aquatilis]MQB52851.1 hypothetical protein [Rahnella sp. RcJ3]NIA89815.1 hypothetical protein [Rahnella aceris]QBJ07442.1 hypothetical protein EYS10_01935 [Rahnella aquatilis]QEU49927.1 hypothetical protein EJP80_25245 [Rahnella aquatilis]
MRCAVCHKKQNRKTFIFSML